MNLRKKSKYPLFNFVFWIMVVAIPGFNCRLRSELAVADGKWLIIAESTICESDYRKGILFVEPFRLGFDQTVIEEVLISLEINLEKVQFLQVGKHTYNSSKRDVPFSELRPYYVLYIGESWPFYDRLEEIRAPREFEKEIMRNYSECF